MRDIDKLRSNITAYVSKNVPRGLPVVSKYIESFITSLLTSSSVSSSLDELDAVSTFSEDSVNFILRDYCSVLGLIYKPVYKDAILRSFIQKDVVFLEWLFSKYISSKFSRVSLSRGAFLEDDVLSVTDIYPSFTDTDLFTDMSSRSLPLFTVFYDVVYKEEVIFQMNYYQDLFLLVLPARLFVCAKFI